MTFEKQPKNSKTRPSTISPVPSVQPKWNLKKTDGTKFTTDDFPRNFFTDRMIQQELRDGIHPGKTTERDVENSQVQNAQVLMTKKQATNARILTCCQR